MKNFEVYSSIMYKLLHKRESSDSLSLHLIGLIFKQDLAKRKKGKGGLVATHGVSYEKEKKECLMTRDKGKGVEWISTPQGIKNENVTSYVMRNSGLSGGAIQWK